MSGAGDGAVRYRVRHESVYRDGGNVAHSHRLRRVAA
jgi:hypothetical protein